MFDAMATNLRIVREQWGDYVVEVRYVVVPGVLSAPWARKPHKLWAFVEEWYDKQPRLNSYLFGAWVVYQVVTL